MKVDMKDSAYFKHNGSLDEEPAATFKDWMERHQYDPEHGKNEPVALPPSQGTIGAAPTAVPPTTPATTATTPQ